MEFKVNTIEESIEDFRNGKFVIVVDDEDRENEGDFIMAAEKITAEHVNFMLKNGRGVLCAPSPNSAATSCSSTCRCTTTRRCWVPPSL